MFKYTPQTGKGEETRAAIFDSALRLFRERGVDATTMRDIAAEAKVASGAAYYYFPSKESIIQAYYERVQAEHHERVTAVLTEKHLDLRQRLRLAMHAKLDIVEQDRRLLGVVFRYSGEPDHPLSCLGPATERLRRGSIEVFGLAVAGEPLPRDLAQLLPVALWALHMGVLILFIYDRSPHQQRTRALADGALDLTVRLLSLARNPLLKPVRTKVMNLLRDTELLPDFSPHM
jgi:AcrR family transcriptional regulator